MRSAHNTAGVFFNYVTVSDVPQRGSDPEVCRFMNHEPVSERFLCGESLSLHILVFRISIAKAYNNIGVHANSLSDELACDVFAPFPTVSLHNFSSKPLKRYR